MTARTPEDLATLLEDALLLGDALAVADLLAGGAVVAGVRGPSAVAAALLARGPAGWADAPDVLQARDLALLGAGGPHAPSARVAVARRGHDGGWRYAILNRP